MQLLNPLAIHHVTLFARDIFDLPRVDQHHFESFSFQELEAGNPIDAGSLHGHGVNAAGLEPLGHFLQVGGFGSKAANRFWIAIRRNTDPKLASSDIDATGVGVDLLPIFLENDFFNLFIFGI